MSNDLHDTGNCTGLHPYGPCTPGSGCNAPPKTDLRTDLHAALAEIMRMRMAAERIVWLASEPGSRYGKGRGQAAQKILDAATERAPRLPVTGRGDMDDDAYVEGLLTELRERARLSEQAWRR